MSEELDQGMTPERALRLLICGVYDDGDPQPCDERLIERYLERKDAKVPDTLVPAAHGFAVVGSLLGYLIDPMFPLVRNRHWAAGGYHTATDRPGWYGKSDLEPYMLWVRKYGDLWSIERSNWNAKGIERVLGFSFDTVVTGPIVAPFLFSRRKEAMQIAKSAHPLPREEARACGISWIATPNTFFGRRAPAGSSTAQPEGASGHVVLG